MINQYLDVMEKVRPLGKTKQATLSAIAEAEFGQVVDSGTNGQRLVEFALANEQIVWRSPAADRTQRFSAPRAVLSIARPAWE